MEPEDYRKHWSELSDQRSQLIGERTTLETSLSDLKKQIAHLDEVLDHLAPLAGIASETDISKLGITDAIRLILKGSEVRMSAPEVRHALEERGFDLSGLSVPMASIYKTLGRLVTANEASRERDEGDFRAYFRWIVTQSEISDDDIPF